MANTRGWGLDETRICGSSALGPGKIISKVSLNDKKQNKNLGQIILIS